jgi:type I restriction enzyme M protein
VPSARGRARCKAFCVPKADIAATGSYDLSLNRYKEIEQEEQKYDAPADIIRELRGMEKQISASLTKLEAMLV